MSSASLMRLLPLAAGDGASVGEAVIVFLGLLAYLVPWILKQRKGLAEAEEDAALPGRRPGRRAPSGGGTFVDPQRAPRRRRKEALDRWRELLIGEEPAPPTRPVRRVPAPVARPVPGTEPEASPTLVELGETIEELHRTLEQRHAQLEETHSGLPGAILGSSLDSPMLSAAPAEDEFETRIDYAAGAGAIDAPARVERASRRPGSRHAWRQAVVLSELFGRPIALRSPSESPGRMPG